MKLLFTIILFILIPPSLLAMNSQQEIQSCWDKKTTADQHQCLANLDATYDEELNSIYKQLSKLSDDIDTKSLQAAQRAWIKFRDAECTFAGSAAQGGSLQPVLIDDKYAELTAARITQLKSYLASVH
jgi:uncharacterized protein YecT (DUF1311 family)